MYAIHTTPGFIIESRPKGEAGKLLYIFTRELGLIMASAQGIRLEKSKLRYYAQEFSLGEFSFVRGKEFWRMTGAGHAQELRITNVELQMKALGMISRIALILRRLLHGEEAHTELFDHVQQSIDFISGHVDQKSLTGDQESTLESLVMFRIVHLLGYVGNDKEIGYRIISAPLSIELIDEVARQRVALNKHINKALRESQL
ncbi:MAG: DNA repair protein RecO [Candidatus Pacebacteria bacterium]|nr:DNA repair protein RecO [Candidatus Paceibacterota bacterium]